MHTHRTQPNQDTAQNPQNAVQLQAENAHQSSQGKKGAIQAKQRPVQRMQGYQAHQAKHQPVQRKTPPNDLKTQMGNQYGVDLSGFKEHQNSSFPSSVNALATIQGKDIHYAPGQYTTQNRKHELGHAIDNTLNGTPKGDKVVNGQSVDTTREQAADKIAETPLQRKADLQAPPLQTTSSGQVSGSIQLQPSGIQNTQVIQRVLPNKRDSLLGEEIMTPPKKQDSISDIAGIFKNAIDRCKHPLQDVVGTSNETLVLEALNQATKSLLFYMEAHPDQALPALETLNTEADLEKEREILVKKPRKITEDIIDHIYQKYFSNDSATPKEKEDAVMSNLISDDISKTIEHRLALDANKAADDWLKVATPYVQVKAAFRNGWETHEHGVFEKRGFYYLLTRNKQQAKDQISGISDTQAGITEPISGKVALAIALQEVYNDAACHADALQFVELLAGQNISRGSYKDGDKDEAELSKIMGKEILGEVEKSSKPLVGVRLRESGQHSLVLLFEQNNAQELVGAKFETVAGRNTKAILALMEAVSPQRMRNAQNLIAEGLRQAIQFSRSGWELEWEVFEMEDFNDLRENLNRHIDQTTQGVKEGLEKNTETDQNLFDIMFYDSKEKSPWGNASKHVEELKKGMPAYLIEKEEQTERTSFSEQETEGREQILDKFYQERLEVALPAEKKALLLEIHAKLGEKAVWRITRKIGMNEFQVLKLMPELSSEE